MHFAEGQVSLEYTRYIKRKSVFIFGSVCFLLFLLLLSVSLGAVHIPLSDVVLTLLGKTISKRFEIIIWNIRLPQAFAAIVAGAGLAVAGAVCGDSAESARLALHPGHLPCCGFRRGLFRHDVGLGCDVEYGARGSDHFQHLCHNDHGFPFFSDRCRYHRRRIQDSGRFP